jgi:hypothetical protein
MSVDHAPLLEVAVENANASRRERERERFEITCWD